MLNRIFSKFFYKIVIERQYITLYKIIMNIFFILSIICLIPVILLFRLIKFSKKVLCPPNWTKIFKVLYEVSNIKFILSFTGFAIISYIVINFLMFNHTFDNFDGYHGTKFISDRHLYNYFIINNYKLALSRDLYSNKYFHSCVINIPRFTTHRIFYLYDRLDQNGRHFFLNFLVKGGFLFYKPALNLIGYSIDYGSLSNNDSFLIGKYYNNNYYVGFVYNESLNLKYFEDLLDDCYSSAFPFIPYTRVKLYSIYIYFILNFLLVLHILFGFLGLSYDYFLKNYSFINNFFFGFSWLQISFILFKICFLIIV